MTRILGWYVNEHVSQYAPTAQPITRTSGCTWTSTRNGADAATEGKVNQTPDQVHALIPRKDETNPVTPGWSLIDAQRALSKLGIVSEDITGQGWVAVENAHRAGFYVLVQGDSDRFGNSTCSGAFDGDHCIGVHPASRSTPEGPLWLIDDPICPTSRWESPAILSSYARKLYPSIRALVVKPKVDRNLTAHVPPGRYLRHQVVPIDSYPGRKIQASRWYRTNTGFTAPCTDRKTVQRRTNTDNVQLVKLLLPEDHPLNGVWIGAQWSRQS